MNLCARLPHKSVQSSKREDNVERDLGVPPAGKNNVKKGAKNWGFCPPGNKEGGKCAINENALRRRKSRKIYMVEIFVFFFCKIHSCNSHKLPQIAINCTPLFICQYWQENGVISTISMCIHPTMPMGVICRNYLSYLCAGSFPHTL